MRGLARPPKRPARQRVLTPLIVQAVALGRSWWCPRLHHRGRPGGQQMNLPVRERLSTNSLLARGEVAPGRAGRERSPVPVSTSHGAGVSSVWLR
jgi:hypothetical protein